MPMYWTPLGPRYFPAAPGRRGHGDGEGEGEGEGGTPPHLPPGAIPITVPGVRGGPDIELGYRMPQESIKGIDKETGLPFEVKRPDEIFKYPDWYAQQFIPKEPRQGRDPTSVALDQLRLRMMEAQFADYPEDRQMQRDIGYGNLALGQGNLALGNRRLDVDVMFGTQDRQFREYVQKWQEEIDNRNFEAAEKWKAKAYALDERAAARADTALSLQAELGYAESRRGDQRANIERANALGRTVGDELGVPAGTLTAGERQAQWARGFAGQQEAARSAEAVANRRQQAGQFLAGLQMQQRQQGFNEQQAAEQNRLANAEMRLRYRQPTGNVFVTPPSGRMG